MTMVPVLVSQEAMAALMEEEEGEVGQFQGLQVVMAGMVERMVVVVVVAVLLGVGSEEFLVKEDMAVAVVAVVLREVEVLLEEISAAVVVVLGIQIRMIQEVMGDLEGEEAVEAV